MSRPISYEFANVMQATFKLDSTTFAAVKGNPDAAVNKAVALTGAETVGFGAANDPIFGIIQKVESDSYATVRTGWFAEGVPVGTEAPAVGDVVVVDGSGGVVAAVSAVYGPTVIRIDGDTAVIRL